LGASKTIDVNPPFALDEPDNPARSRTCAVARPLTPKKS
jgi:hypothetical protein